MDNKFNLNSLKNNFNLGYFLLAMLMWVFGGTLYFFMEVIYKTAVGHQAQISWIMILVAILLCIPLERFGYNLPWEMPMYQQVLISACAITIVEFISGLIINIWLGLNVWDYSNMPYNIMGQICPQFFIVWIGLSYFGIKIFDWLRFEIIGGVKPSYSMFKKHKIDCNCVYCRNTDGKMVKTELKNNNKDRDTDKMMNELTDSLY